MRGLEEAHRYGLPLVSGKRSGNGTSDHDHGDAIDVGTLPIGSPSSNGGTPQMKAFAEHMRLEGKAGRLKVGIHSRRSDRIVEEQLGMAPLYLSGQSRRPNWTLSSAPIPANTIACSTLTTST